MHELKISQLGEGLTQVRVVSLLKQAGELLLKDEPLLEIETDKALMEIEAPLEGRLKRWLVEAGQTVAVGSTVAEIEEHSPANENKSGQEEELHSTRSSPPPLAPSATSPVRNGSLSPREQARLRRESQTAQIEHEELLSPRQSRLSQLLLDSPRFVCEAWMTMPIVWDELHAAGRRFRGLEGSVYRPTSLELIAWCVAQSLQDHPKFRLLNGGARGYQTQDEPSVGVSVGLPDDELTVANVSTSVSDMGAFVRSLREEVRAAQAGRLSPGRTGFVISYMAAHGVRLAVPRLTLPSVASLFVGAPFDVATKAPDGSLKWQRQAHFVLTFDHRIINGVGAATFLKNVISRLEAMTSPPST